MRPTISRGESKISPLVYEKKRSKKLDVSLFYLNLQIDMTNFFAYGFYYFFFGDKKRGEMARVC